MSSPTPDDYVQARRLLAGALFDATPAEERPAPRYQDDLEELRGYAWDDPPGRSELAKATAAWLNALTYWTETGRLVREYLQLQAGAAYSDELRQTFVRWAQHSPGARRQYEQGDDMTRAALVDWFLHLIQ